MVGCFYYKYINMYLIHMSTIRSMGKSNYCILKAAKLELGIYNEY